jgi:hypothetical protein
MTHEEQIIRMEAQMERLREDIAYARNLAREVGENSATLNVLLGAQTEVSREISVLRDHFDERMKELDTRLTEVKTAATSPIDTKTLITIASTIILPILLALIGGYFALKGAQVHSSVGH